MGADVTCQGFEHAYANGAAAGGNAAIRQSSTRRIFPVILTGRISDSVSLTAISGLVVPLLAGNREMETSSMLISAEHVRATEN